MVLDIRPACHAEILVRPVAGSAAAIARVVAGQTLVAVLVVAGDPGHQLLLITGFDVGQELLGSRTAQRGGVPAEVVDPHFAAVLGVLETVGSTCHDAASYGFGAAGSRTFVGRPDNPTAQRMFRGAGGKPVSRMSYGLDTLPACHSN